MATVSPLKEQILIEFNKFYLALTVGKQYDYNKILDMINFLEVGSRTNNPQLIQSFLINNDRAFIPPRFI